MSESKRPKLLVANRSEIACRIFQAAFEMDVDTVAIYVKGDEQARHLTFADEVVEVASYLDAKAIIDVAKKLGVTMIHPGYGFLSERSHFAKAVEDAGIAFLGPVAGTMDQMGGKIAAKEIAERIQVPTVPWAKFDLKTSTTKELTEIAKRIGFPILIKAHAGGGGKGMRRVDRMEDLQEQAESAFREAESSFGDGTLFLERWLQSPRHIEVQVLGDGTGKGVHLFERECSLQRRHQKVWEEAPAPNLSEKVRKGLFESAMKLVKETQYRSAGTIEYLVEGEEYFFIEMNTRLQVEHPVTEAISGVDLVHEQIRIALEGKNYRLPELKAPQGHAIEVRIYAEDPSQGFIPNTGTVDHLIWPTGPGIRVDRGVEVGQEMSMSFDSMCAKLIVHAPTRAMAVKRMQFALQETVISGVGTNTEYLSQISRHPLVLKGTVTTHLLDHDFSEFTAEPNDSTLSMLSAFEAIGGGNRRTGSAGDSLGSGSLRSSSAIWNGVRL